MAKAEQAQRIRIRLKSYDHRLLDDAGGKIVETARRSGAVVTGPVPLPTRIERYTVNRSTHTDKKSQESFEIRTHKRLIDIHNPNAKTVEDLRKINLSAGVEVTIKM